MSALPVAVEEAIVRSAAMRQTSAGSDDLSREIASLFGEQVFVQPLTPEELLAISRRFAEATSHIRAKTLQWGAPSVDIAYMVAEPANINAIPFDASSPGGIASFFAASEQRQRTTSSVLQAFVRSINDNAILLEVSQAVPVNPPQGEDYDFAGVFAVDIAPRIVARHPVRVAIDSLPMRGPVFSPFDPDAFDDDE